MDEVILPELCTECTPDYNERILYDFKFCFRHLPDTKGSEDALLALPVNRFCGEESSEGETNRAWSIMQNEVKGRKR